MARSFNGTTDNIDCGTSQTLKPQTAFTYSVWFKPTTFADYGTIMGYYDAGNPSVAIFTRAGGIGVAYYVLATPSLTADPGSTGLVAGTWYHVALTVDTSVSALRAYINGSLDASVNAAPSTIASNTTKHFYFGFAPAGGIELGQTVLADGAIWNAALTQLEVSALAAGIRPPHIRPKALVAWWPLNGLASPEPDLSGNANNGTLTGTANAFGPPIMPVTRRWPQTAFIPAPSVFTLMPQIVT
jgi:hypothetical protein